jgi:adenosylhomocysteine nucleosidase
MTDTPSKGRFVAVVAALGSELRPLRVLPAVPEVRVFQSGPGTAASTAAAADAVATGALALVSWGVAGGLAATLPTGTVIVSARCQNAAGTAVAGDEHWALRVAALLGKTLAVETGPLLCVEHVLHSPAAKAATQKQTDALAVDMETFAIGAVAAAHDLPWIAVRVVADSAADTLPKGVESCVNAAGNTRVVGVLGLLLKPDQWSALARTARCFGRARCSLAASAALLVPTRFALPGAGSRTD